jgi:DNA-directed RNA polymerase omega subunit
MSTPVEVTNDSDQENQNQPLDSKYRLIIVAAKRSKQLLRGARPRVEMDPQKHKPTRIALEEVNKSKVGYKIITEE